MSPVPEGAQRSEDGYYWWDGDAWQEVPEDERDTSAAGSPSSTASSTATTTTDTSTDSSEMSPEELGQITSEDQLDERSKPYFEPDWGKLPDDDSDAEGPDLLDDEPAYDAAGGN